MTPARTGGLVAGMGDAKTYTGGCHCAKVRYRATTDLRGAMECNCSICSKRAHLLTFVAPEQFELLTDESELTDYQFNTHNIHHLFCSTCGIGSWGHGTGPDGKKMISVNVRCLDDVDLGSLEITQYDGKSR